MTDGCSSILPPTTKIRVGADGSVGQAEIPVAIVGAEIAAEATEFHRTNNTPHRLTR
jgi:hypothetical protein